MSPLIPLAAAFPGFETVWGFFQKGGVFMIPLGLTALAGLMAVIFKALSLTSSRVIPEDLARKISAYQPHLPAEPLIRDFQQGGSTLARLGAVAMNHRGKSHTRLASAIESSAREETVHLHAGIGILDIVITVAPLLGLLGTASGLVVIFQGLGETTNHLAIARGIAEALSTTIFGLAIAVPAVVAHGYFLRKIETLTARLEGLLSDFSHALETPDHHA